MTYEAVLVTRCGCRKYLVLPSAPEQYFSPPREIRVPMMSPLRVPILTDHVPMSVINETRIFEYVGYDKEEFSNRLCYHETMGVNRQHRAHTLIDEGIRQRKKVWEAPLSHPLVRMDAELHK